MTHSTLPEATSDLQPASVPGSWIRPGGAPPLFIVLSGPSGVGKDSVLNHMKGLGLPFHFVVTATSRAPRPHEVDGVDYFFYSTEEFLQMVEAGEFIEHALVYKDYKGIPKSQVREAFATGRDVVVRVDVQGAATIKGLYPQALLIFLSIPTEEELVRRLRRRKTESEDQFELRIETAREEMRRIQSFDYVVQNHDGQLEQTAATILAIITAEHHRVEPREVVV
jgi:guanylate kinase